MELSRKTLNAFALLQLILCLLLLPGFSSAQLQHQPPYYHTHHPRAQLYYEAPRLRRYEYAPSASYISGYPVAPALAGHYQQQQTPNFQLINYRPSYQPMALEYQQQQPPALPVPAPVLPSIYPQPSVQYQQRSIAPHSELSKYRYEGNYLPVQRVAAPPPPPQFQQQQQQQQQLRRVEEPLQQLYNVPPALFTSDVLHVIPPRLARLQEQQQQQPQTERPRRNAPVDAEAAETRTQQKEAPPMKETKYFHDIFMRFDGPHSRSHGHVLKQPKAEERRFEMQRGTNRYKGEVIWTDRQGSHGEHRWDMAQGKL
ncbi:transcriptional regulator DEF1 [Drosophila pseudoobscura]|uniref:Transcriptional regulator DEF1 n=1 Tax=Drosophila pseudoobscura pseudoobscura TaxID=46245 RepID=A0A6I8UC32_DROPS|nr:transcriptional regulator DEF1 [Drosophila pseudoobscura]